MRRILGIIGIVVAVLIYIALSIWLGFPTPKGFDRFAICTTLFLLAFAIGAASIIVLINDIYE